MSEKNFEFEADTGKILDIVINSLYSQKEIFLRELISNASDAINKRKIAVLASGNSADMFDGNVSITADKKAKTLTISDDGIGLSAEEMKRTLGTIASSGTKAFVDSSENADSSDFADQLIGQFGVGFYSAFMVADKIEVVSKAHAATEANLWSSDGKTGFSIESATRENTGTDITLHLRKDAKEYIEPERIEYLVKKYSDHISYPVNWSDPKGESKRLNSAQALWTRQAKDISEDEYQSFYASTAMAYDKPFSVLHNRTEGAIEFTNLLFVPSAAPFDVFEPERRSKLQLYVNRVFITDNCEGLVPKWLRFLRGVVDTPDVDLNVSREMLQQNPVVTKINKAIVKRVLGEFGKALKNRREDYENFWNALGKVVKEGLYEDEFNRAKILEISLFKSSKDDRLTTLGEYVENFAQGQEVIYYLSSENAEMAMTSPHLETFRAKGIDVIVLDDPIDDFWLSNTEDFDGKSFQSITHEDVDISNVGEAKDETENEEPPVSEGLLETMKQSLEGVVSDVRLSANLEKSVARLIADKEAMNPQMERMLRMQNPNFKGSPKILEVNGKHALIQEMSSQIENGNSEDLDKYARLLYDAAIIGEGEAIDEPRDFADRLIDVMEAALKQK